MYDFFKRKIAAWKLLTDTALENCSCKSLYYSHTDQNGYSSQEVECCCLFGDYKMSPVLCHSQDGFPQNGPQTQKSRPPAHNQRVNMWGTECRWLLAPSSLLSLPPSLSCSVKETVMTVRQSLASCGSVCPHLHPTAPAAEQMLCSPPSTGRHPIPLTLTPAAARGALTTRPWE